MCVSVQQVSVNEDVLSRWQWLLLLWPWMLGLVHSLCYALLLVVVWLSGVDTPCRGRTHCLSPLNILKCKAFFLQLVFS